MADTAAHTGSDDPNRRDFIHIAALAAAGGAGVMLAWPLVACGDWNAAIKQAHTRPKKEA